MLRYVGTICCWILLQSVSFAQILLQGSVIDKESNDAIPFATVFLKEYHVGTVTDEYGRFALNIPEAYESDVLVFRALGWNDYEEAVVNIDARESLSILLSPKEYELPEAEIKSLSAAEILRLAIQSLEVNMQTDPYFYDGLYRQVHKENGRYVRLIESCAMIYDQGFEVNRSTNFLQKIAHKQLRKSWVYERNGDRHGDHMVDLFMEDPLRYQLSGIMNEKAIPHYDLKIIEETAYQYVIHFSNDFKESRTREQGKIAINKPDYAVLAIEIDKFKNEDYPSRLDVSYSNWRFLNGHFSLKTDQRGDRYYVSEMEWQYNHEVVNEALGNVEYIVEEKFSWFLDKLYLNESQEDLTDSFKFRNFSNLYSQQYEYDNEFWRDWPIYLQHPLQNDLIEDLEFNGASLSDQFSDTRR